MEITGRLTKNAVSTKIKNDKHVINFSIAINDSYKPKGASTVKEVVTYINCDYWLSPALLPYLKKGALVQLYGRIGLSVYLSSDGNPLGSLTFHINHLKILVFAKKESVSLSNENNKHNTADIQHEDLPF